MENREMSMKLTTEMKNADIESIRKFAKWLQSEERSNGTIEKYTRDVRSMYAYLNGKDFTKENALMWKTYLLEQNYQPATINSMLASINTFCKFTGADWRIKLLRIQRRLFCEEKREITKIEYERLICAAYNNRKERLGLLLETIGGTGIRVSEVKYFTVENVRTGHIRVSLKGKIREIFLPKKLRRKLLEYAKRRKISSGEIFITKNGRGLSRKQIWAEMKKLCKEAGVAASKVFPHNLRHLFAKVFYKVTKDLTKLSDMLGHSSIETTRIYLRTPGTEHAWEIERLGLIS